MGTMKIGNVVVVVRDGLLSFHDPQREMPVHVKISDMPLLMDLLDSLEWDRRCSRRVPVSRSAELRAKLTHAGNDYLVRPVDISLGGVLVESRADGLPNVDGEQLIQVTLEWNNLRAVLQATVRRRTESQLGLCFLQSKNGQTADVLQQIFNCVEANWLNVRIYGGGREQAIAGK